MFFNKINLNNSNVFAGVSDCHSHILPGVDDGVKSVEEACDILFYFETLGVEQVILTPHIMEDYPLNNPVNLNTKFNTLCEAYTGTLKLSLGAEYMLDGAFEEHLNSDDLMPIFDNYILIETSYMNAPINFLDLINRIQAKGYHIILAHPERYIYMDSDYYKRLKERNVLFQMNVLSPCGGYGNKAQKKSKKLLNRGYYDYIGSDIHSLRSFRREIERAKLPKSIISSLYTLKMK